MYQAAVRQSLRCFYSEADHRPAGAAPEENHFTVELLLGRTELTPEGEVVDRSIVESCLGEVLSALEGRSLNDADWFDFRPATPENVACFLAEEVAGRLSTEGIDPAAFARFELRLWVSQGFWASYGREPVPPRARRTPARAATVTEAGRAGRKPGSKPDSGGGAKAARARK